MQKELLDILACPRCHASLILQTENGTAQEPTYTGLVCQPCGVLYPIRDDIPIMLIEEAIPFAHASKTHDAPSTHTRHATKDTDTCASS